MSLVEVARYSDVYEADLAAAFLESHGVTVCVTERFQTTIDPLMQRALGIRLLVRRSDADTASDLLAQVEAGEFADRSEQDINPIDPTTRTAGSLLALAAWATGGFWGTSLPRRVRPPAWQGMLLSAAIVLIGALVVLLVRALYLYPP